MTYTLNNVTSTSTLSLKHSGRGSTFAPRNLKTIWEVVMWKKNCTAILSQNTKQVQNIKIH